MLAILSAPGFDAPQLIDPLSLKLGLREANIIGMDRSQDVDRDGNIDLVVRFLVEQTGIECGATSVNLNGRTYAGGFVFGSDTVNTTLCPRQ